MTESNTQLSAITNKFGDVYIDVVNQNHFSNNSALKIYEKILKNNLNKPRTLYVVIGSDSGLFPKSMERLDIPEGSAFLFIELDPLYPIMLSQLNGMTLHKCIVANLHDWEELFDQEGFEKYIYDEKVLIINSLAAEQGHITDYPILKEKVLERLKLIRHERISTTDQEKFIKEQLINAVDNIKPAKLLENTASGTAIVLGAGPSLNEFLPWIKENEDKVTIIAVSRIYQQLQKANITPDIIVSSDPFNINYEQSKAFLADDSIIFIHTNHVSYRLPAQWGGISFYRDKRFPWETKSNPENVENEGPTVTHTALAQAIEMGFQEIYLAGVDLCYSNELTHADGQELEENKNLSYVETYAGDKAPTDNNLKMGTRDLSEIALRRSVKIYNLNKKAAKVSGISLAEKPHINSNKYRFEQIEKPTQEERKKHVELVKNELRQARLAYSVINKLVTQAVALNEKIFETNDQIRINKIQIKLDNIEKKLKDNYSPYLHPAQLIASKEFLQLLNTNKDIKSHEEQYIWLKNYYTAYKNGTYIILNLIDSATPFIETRKLELKPRLNVEEIIQRWIDSKIVGRSCFYEINGNYCKDFHFTISQNRRAQMLVNKALSEGRNNNFETAIQFIENAYKSDDKLQDAYAKLGWIYTNNKEWDKAWEIAKHDYDKKRLSSTWKIKVAEILLRTNHVSQSIQLIFDAYDENPQLKNCYARLGWILGYTTKNWEYALKIAYKDLETNRLDAMWKMRIGLIFGNTFNIDMADKLIAESYQENEKLTDGYAKLGWILYKKNIIDQAIKFTKRDIKFNRLSVFWKSKIIDLIEICETEVV